MEKYDKENIYCRSLGHYVPFKYCRTLRDGMPCNKILDCTFERIEIKNFLDENYSDKEIADIISPSKNKIVSILELIEKSKKI